MFLLAANVNMTLRQGFHAAIISDAALPHHLGKRGFGTGLNAALPALCDGLHFKRVPGWHLETKYSLAAGYLAGEVL